MKTEARKRTITGAPGPIRILMADDDDDDRFLARIAFAETELVDCVRFVEDGQELLDYLRQRGRYTDPEEASLPSIILLDLNMPRMDGREALKEIKRDPDLRHIPVIVLTTSQERCDVLGTYNLGANSFVPKPVSFAAMVEFIQTLEKYWFETVALPQPPLR